MPVATLLMHREVQWWTNEQREFTELCVDDARTHLCRVDLGVNHTEAAAEPDKDWNHHHHGDERTTISPLHRQQFHYTTAVVADTLGRFAELPGTAGVRCKMFGVNSGKDSSFRMPRQYPHELYTVRK